MKTVYFGTDLFCSCLAHLYANQFEILTIYTCEPASNVQQVSILAQQNKTKITTTKPTKQELDDLVEQGAQLFVVADYAHLLPSIDAKYAINIHPSLLPAGKGATPLPYLIAQPEFAGVSIHKLSEQLDKGDVLIQQPVTVGADDSIRSLMVKVQLLAKDMLGNVLQDIEYYYQQAKPQSENNSSYWPVPSLAQRTIHWYMSVSEINLISKQYGQFGVVFNLGNEQFISSQLEVSLCQHSFPAGTILYQDDYLYVIALIDGFVCFDKKALSQLNIK
ncbi:methionyl-tRNA formyltransferase [Saccharobesus litoralis]|uniref:Methionyl-tRNA formyltransferase n=1 Tax=Saccharobesus litoralis TaxID=2172099 RepID=A0A2S0VUI0_9ALTE|nr:formyltransferase family protein [Saccharobesus litoralis]AWB67877.1 methionyl-tRNA formyltransferase [Saccharobesus litoralis]